MSLDRTAPTTRALTFAAAAAFVLIAAGCSSDKAAAPTTTAAKATTTVAAPATTDSTKPTDATSPATAATTAPTEATTADTTADTTAPSDTTAATSEATVDTTTAGGDAAVPVWEQNAVAHRGQNGKTFTIDCTKDGTPGPIWGTETYTDDSSICTAAVHVGLITVATGGKVSYQIAAGTDTYPGMDGNGITSSQYGEWPGSFVFPDAPPGSGTFTPSTETWDESVSTGTAAVGDKIVVDCSTDGHLGSVWGTGTYTSDSSICTAAVLEGLVTVDKGGVVVVDVTAGQDSYKGSTKNGVTSSDYAAWGLSFTFPKDQTPPPTKTTSDTTTPTT
ncbi:MAG: hypothetical protein JWN39_2859 [Ilumatobacteraceae bacterium]|nr:hypothetical protein [Ilumatobacteraceae bacterium]